ncbi:hypothetical protein CLU79DRAFT_574687 [Phycomyces nitens]|nr:hypothetical protein CLU79DRAFT_574687 [Phycomyces nitens]
MLENLSNDLLNTIASFLPLKDQATCVSVSRRWHDIFKYILYSKIQLKNERQGTRFTKSNVMTQSNVPNSYKYLVRSFTIRWANGEKTQDWRLILKAFPFLQDLSVSAMLWNELVKPKEGMPSLTRLAINSRYAPLEISNAYAVNLTHFSAMRFQKSLLCAVISKMPSLEDLTIQVIKPTPGQGSPVLTFQDIENIHRSSPHLQSIYLRELTITGDVPSSPTPSIVNCFKIKGIKLMTPEWISYFANKYPKLSQLSIQVIRAPWKSKDDPDMIERHNDSLEELKPGYVWSDLETLSLSNITDNRAFFKTRRFLRLLSPSCRLRHIKINGSRVKPFSVDLDIDWVLSSFSGLRVLQLERINVLCTLTKPFIHSCLLRMEIDGFQVTDEMSAIIYLVCPKMSPMVLK